MRPLILVCNDDGITAPGIKALIEAVEPLGDVVVVAPDSPQSGMGHAITIGDPIRMHQVEGLFGTIKAFEVSGTPVDCVKLAVDKIINRKPSLLVSGINHGANNSINVLYSGTMSAAMEGAIEGIPSIGFSLCDFSHYADFTLAGKIARLVSQQVLEHGLQPDTLLNVNIPKLDEADFKGIRICRQAKSKWSENFEERVDPRGRKYFWMTGAFNLLEEGDDTDEWALRNGYASIVPTQFDLTAYKMMSALTNWNLDV